MTTTNDLQGGDDLHGAALALDCLTLALRLVPAHAPQEKLEAMVWQCVARASTAARPLGNSVQESLKREIQKLLEELRTEGL